MIKRWLFKRLSFLRKPYPSGISGGPIFRPIFSEEVDKEVIDGTEINREISNKRESVY